jgi:hypothetical protein
MNCIYVVTGYILAWNVLIILKYYIYIYMSADANVGTWFRRWSWIPEICYKFWKASMIYLSPVQTEHAKRKWLGLDAVLSG